MKPDRYPAPGWRKHLKARRGLSEVRLAAAALGYSNAVVEELYVKEAGNG